MSINELPKKMTTGVNPNITWTPFPRDPSEFIAQFGGKQVVMLVKCAKAIDPDFNPQGVFFGMLYSPSGEMDEMNFNTSRWNGSDDYYADKFVVSKNSSWLDGGVKDFTDWHIEDMDSYFIVEVYKF